MKKRLPIIDYDLGIQDAYVTLFELAEYEVTVSPNYYDQSKIMNPMPHIILLNKQLPGQDGLEICRQLKANEATRGISIVIMSATCLLEKKAIEAGAQTYLEKPIDIYILKKTVNEWANTAE